MSVGTLPEGVWVARRAAHEARVDAWIAPVLARAQRGEAHPVEDFLFTYYTHRPAQLRRWSPGAGVVVTGPAAQRMAGQGHWVGRSGGAALGPPPPSVSRTAGWVVGLLERTASRPAQFGCFGLHEWAMVHRQQARDVRHSQVPLRLGAEGTDAVVESMPLRCTHFDAFRFFTPSARPRNATQPSRESQPDLEQSGCLHATMDLYKWAYKLSPWVPAELVADCFELARRVRTLDMRASPYDLRALGLDPVRIETAPGRAEYAAGQREFAAAGEPLRSRLAALARGLR